MEKIAVLSVGAVTKVWVSKGLLISFTLKFVLFSVVVFKFLN